MEAQLENLIEKLKSEGVQAARQQSGEIVGEAKNEAQQITDNAKNKAEQIISQAKQEMEKSKASAEAAIKQAARDLILVIKEKIVDLFDRALKTQIQKPLSPDFLKELIMKFVEQIGTESTIEVIIGEAEKAKLLSFLQSTLKNELKNDVEIKVSNRITRGFRIGVKDQDVYYDFTDESITASLKEFLNPSLSKLLKTPENGNNNG